MNLIPGIIGKKRKNTGLPPGTPVYIGEETGVQGKALISVTDYNQEEYACHEVVTPKECVAFKESETVSWISVTGLNDVKSIQELGTLFGLHPLTIEDIPDTRQRPKLDVFKDHAFIVLKSIYRGGKGKLKTEHLSMVLGENYVITFKEKNNGLFDAIMSRLKNSSGRIRHSKSDYLFYAVVDSVVDNYFELIDELGEKLEKAELKLTENKTENATADIHKLRREITSLRKNIRPLRYIVNELRHEHIPNVKKDMIIYLRDLYDHIVQAIENIEIYRDMITGMLDIYLSSINNGMNKIMQFLTILGTIFLPLTFITGIYGMNFENMPELKWHWAYYFVLCVMTAIAGSMLFFFKKKKWL